MCLLFPPQTGCELVLSCVQRLFLRCAGLCCLHCCAISWCNLLFSMQQHIFLVQIKLPPLFALGNEPFKHEADRRTTGTSAKTKRIAFDSCPLSLKPKKVPGGGSAPQHGAMKSVRPSADTLLLQPPNLNTDLEVHDFHPLSGLLYNTCSHVKLR